MKISKWGWLLIGAVLALSAVGCGGGSSYDDELPTEARATVKLFLASWEAGLADSMISAENVFAFPFTANIYGYTTKETVYNDKAALVAADGFEAKLNGFFADRVADNVVLNYRAETEGDSATASGTFKAYLTSGFDVKGSFSFYFVKEGEHWLMNRFYIGPAGG